MAAASSSGQESGRAAARALVNSPRNKNETEGQKNDQKQLNKDGANMATVMESKETTKKEQGPTWNPNHTARGELRLVSQDILLFESKSKYLH